MLTSIGSPVTSDDVVMFALEGLPEKYDHVCGIITHRDPFSNLKTTRSMFTTKEMRLKSKSQALHVDSSSSSPMIIVAESGNTRRPSTPQVKSWRPCFNFAKGSCRFGSGCKFVLDVNAKSSHNNDSTKQGSNSSSNTPGNNTEELLTMLLGKLEVSNTLPRHGNNNTNSTDTKSSTVPFTNPCDTPRNSVQ
ncbi:hybrid signal transduction histidine kinase M [Tanacetum coccineum]